MKNIATIALRELKGYFSTPIAYVFIVIFVMLSGVFTFHIGGFFTRGSADLQAFFVYLPWLFLVLIPAIAMRLWAEERRSGTIELLMTLPLSTTQAVVGKWLAGTVFIGICLAGTFPLWLSVNYLGEPDNGAIAIAYLGAFLLSSVFLAIGACFSAMTRNQVIAFVLGVAMCFVFVTAGTPIVLDAVRQVLPQGIVSAIASLGILSHFQVFVRGEVALSGLIYIVSMVTFWLFANVVIIDMKKAD